jgi:RNA polymerase sigma-70 factor, ECF subfamily
MGQVGNLKHIFEQHQERLFHYLLRMTGDYDLARDILQECVTRCLERYGRQIDSPGLLYRVARNLVVDHARKQARTAPLGDQPMADPRSMEHHLMIRETYREVLAALQELSFEDRELLSLVAAETMTYGEIAVLMNTTDGAVKVRIHRARKRLRQILAKRGDL